MCATPLKVCISEVWYAPESLHIRFVVCPTSLYIKCVVCNYGQTLNSEGGEIMKIYVIDLILEYISPLPWYCPWAMIYSSIQSITG